jgi:ParB family transcriptional regulator, chromosome partitioning protein
VVRQSGLGKGLGALIPTGGNDSAMSPQHGHLVELPLSSIIPNRFQTRETFDEASLDTLASSIKELGVLQPILVRESPDGSYELIAGERRWRASRRAGLSRIPAIIRSETDERSILQVLVENLQREDLDPLEEAAGFQQMADELKSTHEEIALRVGRSRSAVTNSLRLLQLSPSIQKLVKTRELSAGHARALLPITDRSYQESLARRIVQEGLTVRAVEDAVTLRANLAGGKSGKGSSARAPKPTEMRPAGFLELEEMLEAQLDTKVSIEVGPKNGKITIVFADIEDLERIFVAMNPSTVTEDGQDLDEGDQED